MDGGRTNEARHGAARCGCMCALLLGGPPGGGAVAPLVRPVAAQRRPARRRPLPALPGGRYQSVAWEPKGDANAFGHVTMWLVHTELAPLAERVGPLSDG